MARVVTVTSTGVQTIPWTVDATSQLVGISGNNGAAVAVSRDPNVTAAVPTTGTVDNNLIGFIDLKISYRIFPPITLYKDEKVYLGFGAAAICSLYLIHTE